MFLCKFNLRYCVVLSFLGIFSEIGGGGGSRERVEICKEIYQECEWAECRAESQARWPISSEDRERPGASWQPVSPICGASESVQ